jgi:hypothetical protein
VERTTCENIIPQEVEHRRDLDTLADQLTYLRALNEAAEDQVPSRPAHINSSRAGGRGTGPSGSGAGPCPPPSLGQEIAFRVRWSDAGNIPAAAAWGFPWFRGLQFYLEKVVSVRGGMEEGWEVPMVLSTRGLVRSVIMGVTFDEPARQDTSHDTS